MEPDRAVGIQQDVGDTHKAVPRILVVDDEKYMCDLCTRTLRHASYEVVSTTDALFALQKLKARGSFDLLLADIKMPMISGLDLAHHAREVDPAIAIVIMTGHTSTEHLRQAVQRGVADFISKPFELAELRLAVDRALHKRQLLQDSLRLRAVEQLLFSSEAIINSTLDRQQLGHIILQMALEQIGCQAAFLFFVEHSYGIDQQHTLGLIQLPDDRWQILAAGSQVAWRTFAEGTALVIDSEQALCGQEDMQINRGLSMPLRSQGEVVGILLLCDNGPDMLRLGAQEMVALLANQAGAALRNAHLYGQLEETFQRLQELDRLKSEFIAIASHELRTPLSIVLGYAAMVRDKSDDERREYAQRVIESAQRIRDIIDDMVNLRHLDAGEVSLSRDICVVQDIVTRAVKRLSPTIHKKNLSLSLHVPDGLVPFVADREKVLLVLGNLISNAIKFTPENGKIGITVAIWSGQQMVEALQHTTVPVTITRLDYATEWIVIEVWDTGIGIPQHELIRIFERFYQVAASLTRQQGGTGLGLSIVRELTVVQGGMAWVESVQGEGSRFFFALPYLVP